MSAPAASLGFQTHRHIPLSILNAPLTDETGAKLSLSSFRGRTIVFVPFLTLCSEVCPLTTGNLLQLELALRRDHATNEVSIIELSVDPFRDTPQRLLAYQRLTGTSWTLVTESPSTLKRIARFFGIFYQKVPEVSPASIDWLTHKPLTYDVAHGDGFYIIDSNGKQRFVTGATPSFKGHLNPKLYRFLSAQGLRHLHDSPSPNWTPKQLLGAIAWVLGRSLSPRGL